MLFRQVIVLVPIALAFSVGACSSPTPIPIPTPVPSTTPTVTQPATQIPSVVVPRATPTQGATSTPNPKDSLLAALSSALSKIKTYRARVPEEGRLMEVVLPDRIRQLEDEPITRIGSTYFQPNLDPVPRTVGTVPFMDRVNLVWFQDQVSKSSGTSFLGPVTIDGTPCIGYSTNFAVLQLQFAPTTSPGATPVATQLAQPVKVWFSTTDGYPRRIEYGAPNSVTANFFDFNASIEINPP